MVVLLALFEYLEKENRRLIAQMMNDSKLCRTTDDRNRIVDRIMKLAGQSYTFDSFLAKDICYDPVRDGASNAPAARTATDASGRQDNLPLMPLLPPPVLHIVE